MTAWQQSPNIRTLKIFGILAALCLAGFYLIESVLIPVIISFVFYALLDPAANYLVRRNISRSVAILLVLLFLIYVSLLALAYAVPALVDQAAVLQAKLPQVLLLAERTLDRYLSIMPGQFGDDGDTSGVLLNLLAQTTSFGQAALIRVSDGVLSLVIVSILVPFLTYYLLRDFKQARNNLMNCLPNSSFELGWVMYNNVARQLNAYVHGVMIQSAIMAAICAAGFSLIGIDSPLLLGGIAGILNLAPYIGPIISMVLAALVGATMTPFDPAMIYLGISIVLCAQFIDNVVVVPQLIAGVANLHPVQVILGIIVFGNLFGMLGVILAIPAIAVGKIVYNNLYADIRNASQRLPR